MAIRPIPPFSITIKRATFPNGPRQNPMRKSEYSDPLLVQQRRGYLLEAVGGTCHTNCSVLEKPNTFSSPKIEASPRLPVPFEYDTRKGGMRFVPVHLIVTNEHSQRKSAFSLAKKSWEEVGSEGGGGSNSEEGLSGGVGVGDSTVTKSVESLVASVIISLGMLLLVGVAVVIVIISRVSIVSVDS
jgi:hypothetical protein